MGISIEPEITGKYRMGDIRHCYADISKMKDQLGYTPGIDLDHGLSELAGWLQKQTAEDKVSHAGKELATCGLTIRSEERRVGKERGRRRATRYTNKIDCG